MFACVLLPGLVLHLASHTPTGDGTGDSYQNMWYLWWVGRALRSGSDIYHTDRLFWPVGTSLVLHTLTPANGVLSLPVQMLWTGTHGLLASYNLLTLASFALTGLGVHLLARDHGASLVGACTAGALAMSVPYRFVHLNHLNLLSTQWCVITLVLLMRTLARGSLGSALALGVTAALTTYSDYESAVYTLMACLILIAVHLATQLRSGVLAARLLPLGAASVVALLLHLPLLGALLDPSRQTSVPPLASYAHNLSANLLAVFSPPPSSLMWAPWHPANLAAGNGTGGDEAAVGCMFVTVLAGLALVRRQRAALPWLGLGAFFMLLALGPSLRVGSATYLENAMPYAWLTRALPALNMGRSPVRMCNMAGIFWAVALGLLIHPPGQRIRRGLSAVLIGLLALERAPAHAPALEAVHVPQVYTRLAAEPGDFAIMPAPLGYVHQQVYMFWQTVHAKALTSGGGARRAPEAGRFIQAFARAQSEAERLELLHAANVRYMIVHTPQPGELMTREPRVLTVPR